MADSQSNAALSAPPLPEGAPPAGVIHVRHRHADRFTVVGNHLAQHPRLSAVAIGLAVHIQSLPDGAPVSVKALAARFPEGEVTVRRAMNELQAAGYLERRRVPLGGGRFATRAFAYDRPGSPAPASGPSRRDGRGSRPGPRPDSGSGRGLRSGRALPGGRGLASGTVRSALPALPALPAVPAVPAAGPGAVRRAPVARPAPAGGHVPAMPSPGHGVGPALAAPGPGAASPAPARRAEPVAAPQVSAPPSGPAVDILARLRQVDPRLLLSARDVARLAPGVDGWLARAVTPAQVTRALTAGLPPAPDPIHHPAGLLAHRLAALLPPPLPPDLARSAPLRSCDGCERAFRTHDPAARCGDCRA